MKPIEIIKNNLVSIIIINLVFTVMDYIGHKYMESNYSLYVVPISYFYHKLIAGALLLFLGAYIVSNFMKSSGLILKSIVISAMVILILQLRYITIYDSEFNYTVMALHFVILMPLVWFSLKQKFLKV